MKTIYIFLYIYLILHIDKTWNEIAKIKTILEPTFRESIYSFQLSGESRSRRQTIDY